VTHARRTCCLPSIGTPPARHPQPNTPKEKAPPSAWDERASQAFVVPPTFRASQTKPHALGGPITGPVAAVYCCYASQRHRKGQVRRRASGWSSPSRTPGTALSRWPFLAVGARRVLVPLIALATVSIPLGALGVKAAGKRDSPGAVPRVSAHRAHRARRDAGVTCPTALRGRREMPRIDYGCRKKHRGTQKTNEKQRSEPAATQKRQCLEGRPQSH